LIDTPGFDHSSMTEAELLTLLSDFLKQTYQDGRTLHGILYLHRISDGRVGGTARNNLHLFRRLCGDESLQNVHFVTNFWADVRHETGEARELELGTEKFFKPALDHGARIVRHDNTKESAHDILRQLLTATPRPLLMQTEMVDEEKEMPETTVGKHLQENLEKMRDRAEERYEDLKRKIEALASDLKHRKERVARRWQRTSTRAQLARIEKELEQLGNRLANEQQAHGEKITRLLRETEAREERLVAQFQAFVQDTFKQPATVMQVFQEQNNPRARPKEDHASQKTVKKGLWTKLRALLWIGSK